MSERMVYLDCFSGISGDMTVAALIDLGVPPSVIDWEVAKLDLGAHLHVDRRQSQSVTGVKFTVHEGEAAECSGADAEPHTHEHEHPHDQGHTHSHEHTHSHDHPHEHDHDHVHHEHTHSHEHPHVHGRTHGQIRALISASELSDFVKTKSLAIFARIAEAEGRIHGVPAEDVGFHEVGAVDSIVDIVAVCVGIEHLGCPVIGSSVLFDGSGWIDCAHGRYPIPAMATLEILKGIPFRQIDEEFEFVTPTGAALVAEFSQYYGPMPELVVEKIGYGLGTRTLPGRPNALRAVLGETASERAPSLLERDEAVLLETNLDDLTPELLAAATQRLMDSGALDVWITATTMKKQRVGWLLSVLVEVERESEFAEAILRTTSAFGVRRSVLGRWKLARSFHEVTVAGFPIRIKIGTIGIERVQASPEFEDCLTVATETSLPVRAIYEKALLAFHASKDRTQM